MRHYDFSPLTRSFIGFDRMATMIEAASKLESTAGYPPYNVEQINDDQYRIELAVAGFDQSELTLETHQNVLTVTGRKPSDEEARNFVHRGIAGRGFERRFQLADHVRVTQADIQNGLLVIELVRDIPEALRPRTIEIGLQALGLDGKAAEDKDAANDKSLTGSKPLKKVKAA